MIIPRRIPYFPPNVLSKLLRSSINQKDQISINKNVERLLERDIGIPNPILVASGRIGLVLILKNSGIKKGSEIIMPGYTFGLLTKIIKRAGFIPKPVDIDYENYQMSSHEIEKAITKNTSSILATHLFGENCDIIKIKKIAKKNKLFLIEDCAQSLGAKLNGQLVGTFGDAAFSSFNIAKPLQSIIGGVVFSKDKDLIQKIRNNIQKKKSNIFSFLSDIKTGLFGYFVTRTIIWPIAMFVFSFKSTQRKFVEFYRHDELKKNPPVTLHPLISSLLSENINTFKKRLIRRRKIRSIYTSLLKNYVSFQKIQKGSKGSVYMIVGHVKCDIFKLRRYLSLNGIDIALADEIADDCLNQDGSSIKRAILDSIALPIYENLTKKDIIYISNKIKWFINNQKSSDGVN